MAEIYDEKLIKALRDFVEAYRRTEKYIAKEIVPGENIKPTNFEEMSRDYKDRREKGREYPRMAPYFRWIHN